MSLFPVVLVPLARSWVAHLHHAHCTWDPAPERGSHDGRSGGTDNVKPDSASPPGSSAIHRSTGEQAGLKGARRLARGGGRTVHAIPPSCPPPRRLPVAGVHPEGGRCPRLPQPAFQTRSAALAEALLLTPAPCSPDSQGDQTPGPRSGLRAQTNAVTPNYSIRTPGACGRARSSAPCLDGLIPQPRNTAEELTSSTGPRVTRMQAPPAALEELR